MPEKPAFNYEEAIHGVLETKTALERAGASMDRLQQLLSERPAAFAPLAQLAFRLRDRLVEDLGSLEAQLAQVNTAGEAGAAQSGSEPPKAAAEDRNVPLGDAVALGGQ